MGSFCLMVLFSHPPLADGQVPTQHSGAAQGRAPGAPDEATVSSSAWTCLQRGRGKERSGTQAPVGQSAVYPAFVSLGVLAPSHAFLSSVSSLCSCPVSLSLCVSITLFPHFSLLFLFHSLCLSAGRPNPAPDSSLQSPIPILHGTDFGVTEGGHTQSLEAPI